MANDLTFELAKIFKLAVEKGASDILITANSAPILRICGDLGFVQTGPLTPELTKRAVYQLLNSNQIARFEADKELDFSIYLEDARQRFRGNAYLQRGTVAAAFRLIPTDIPTLDSLNLPAILGDMAAEMQGLILVTGPTGHGKSTTQAAMIDVINTTRKCHIIIVEDPIEYLHTNKRSVIDQREVGDDTLGFPNALKHVLRQDPDVILIGEMRDLDTISSSLTAAETGHLVISTLHTNDVVQAIDRLLDVFPPHQQGQIRSQLSLSLLAIIGQRLIARRDGKGMVPAVEILMANAAVRNLIRKGDTPQMYGIMETHSREGMVTMDTAIKDLYLSGIITYEEAKKRMRTPGLLREI
ncbi:type IV pilus twitching motility protein PilT [Planctomycetota bacterium]